MSRSLKLTRPSSIRLILDSDERIRHPASSRLIPRASRNWRRWAPSIMRKAVGPPVEALRVAGVVTVDLRLLNSPRLAGSARPKKPRASPGNRSPLGLARYGAELVDLSEGGRDLVGIVGRGETGTGIEKLPDSSFTGEMGYRSRQE